MIWRCPKCRGALAETAQGACCGHCGSRYGRVGNVLDLRLPGPSWVDFEADNARARRMLAETEGQPAEAMIRWSFATRPGWTAERASTFARRALEAPHRLRREFRAWLAPLLEKEGPLLEVGCGSGMLLAAAAAEGKASLALDVSMSWLVVADRLVREWGGKPQLVAGLAEALPLPDECVNTVVALDVFEHVGDQAKFLSEVSRVAAPEAVVAMATPNRFSLAAEPHVSLWGVGFLPRSWQKPYVRWRCKDPYDFVRLVSVPETRRMLRRHTAFDCRMLVPQVSSEEIGRYPGYRRVLARMYNYLARRWWMRPMLLGVGPFFRVVGRKRGVAAVAERRPAPVSGSWRRESNAATVRA